MPFLSPGDCPNPGIEPRSPRVQADSLPSEPHQTDSYLNIHILFQILSQNIPLLNPSGISEGQPLPSPLLEKQTQGPHASCVLGLKPSRGPQSQAEQRAQGWKRQEAHPGVRKGLRGPGTTRRRGVLGSAPQHGPVFLTSFGSNSEQAEHGTSSSGSFPATLLPKQHLSRGSK